MKQIHCLYSIVAWFFISMWTKFTSITTVVSSTSVWLFDGDGLHVCIQLLTIFCVSDSSFWYSVCVCKPECLFMVCYWVIAKLELIVWYISCSRATTMTSLLHLSRDHRLQWSFVCCLHKFVLCCIKPWCCCHLMKHSVHHWSVVTG